MNFWKVYRGWILAAGAVAAAVVVLQLTLFRAKPVDVRVARVERGVVEETVVSTKAGSVRSRQIAEVSAETSGAIVEIHARRGKAVERGVPLISIDARDAEAALAASEKEIKVLEQNILEADIRRIDAEKERDRRQGLDGSVSKAELDQAETQARAAAAAHGAAKARLEALVEARRRAQIALDKSVIRAPFAGVVAELHVEVGEWAVPGKVVLRLLQPDDIYIRAELDEIDIAELRPGLTVRVTLDPYKGRKIAGTISRVGQYVSEVKEQNRTVEIEVEFTEDVKPLRLKHGMSADVEAILRTGKPEVLRIPTLALMEGGRVLVIGADRRAEVRPVRTGLRNWEYTQILEGLAEGEPVITSLESEKVKEGVPVRVVQEAAR